MVHSINLHNKELLSKFHTVIFYVSLDFYNANEKIAVEVQGAQHTKFVEFFHKTKADYINQLRRDKQKKDFCELNNITLVEIFPDDTINKSLFKKFNISL